MADADYWLLIKDLIINKKYSVNELSAETKIPTQRIYKWLSKTKIASPKGEDLRLIGGIAQKLELIPSSGNAREVSLIEKETKDYRLMYENLQDKTNNQLSEAINSVFILAKEIALSLTQFRSDHQHFAQTQIDNQRVLLAGMNYLLGLSGQDQQPKDNPGNKSSLPGDGQ